MKKNKAHVIGQNAQIVISLEYQLKFKKENKPKATNLYYRVDQKSKKYILLDQPFQTWEIVVLNTHVLRKFIEKHNNFKWSEYGKDKRADIHINESLGYDIICYSSPLASQEDCEKVIDDWLILLMGLAFEDDFKEANEYCKNYNKPIQHLKEKNGWEVIRE